MKKFSKLFTIFASLMTAAAVFAFTGCGAEVYGTVHLIVENDTNVTLTIDDIEDKAVDTRVYPGDSVEFGVQESGRQFLGISPCSSTMYIHSHYKDNDYRLYTPRIGKIKNGKITEILSEGYSRNGCFYYDSLDLDEDRELTNISTLRLRLVKIAEYYDDYNRNEFNDVEYALCIVQDDWCAVK